MKMIKIDKLGPKIDKAEITSLENALESSLPDDYRQFLMKYNGGTCSPDIVDIEGFSESPTDIQVFFGIRRSVASSDLSWNLRLVRIRYSSHGILPIACDSGGNFFCLRKKNNVFDISYVDIKHTPVKNYYVARDFSAFLDKIRLWKD